MSKHSSAPAQEDDASAPIRLKMSNLLSKAQMDAQLEIMKVDSLVKDLSLRLAGKGLNSSEMRSAMNEMLVQHPCLVSMITFDPKGIVLAAEPASFHALEAIDLSQSPNVAEMLATWMPVMSDVFQPQRGPAGSAISMPAFDRDGKFIGSVSALFSVPAMMNAILPRLVEGTGFSFTILQRDGKIIYDTDAEQIGMITTHGDDFAGFPQLQALAARVVKNPTGWGTHSYYVDLAGSGAKLFFGIMTERDCYSNNILLCYQYR
jgi:hypothetical protein